jgi:3-oxoacyl-[acyl-carrier protein] reductase
VDLHLSEKRPLVTGSTAGIGAAIARQLASEGVAVVIHGRYEQRGQRLAAELTGAGRRAVFIGADLARSADIARLASQARVALGAIDIFVNNAAIYPQHTWFEGAADEWTRYYELNVVAGVRLIQEVGATAGTRSKRTFWRATFRSLLDTLEPLTTSRASSRSSPAPTPRS